jgi:ribose transport system permease protein
MDETLTARERALRPDWRRARNVWRDNRMVIASYIVLVALILLYVVVEPNAAGLSELNVQVAAAMALIFVTAGQAIALISGNFDLSVGATVSFATVIGAKTMESSGILVAILLIVAMGCAVGFVNGFIVAYGKVNSLITTLATWSILSGIVLLVMPQPGGTVPVSFLNEMGETYSGIALSTLIVAAGIVVWLWYRGTRSMSRIRAIGSNPEAARLAGISVNKVTIVAFVLCGALSALGGLFLLSQLGAGDPLVGNSFVLESVAAAVVGGTALSGGRGDVLGALAGALILTLLGSVIFALELPSYWQVMGTGLLLFVAAAINVLISGQRKGDTA